MRKAGRTQSLDSPCGPFNAAAEHSNRPNGNKPRKRKKQPSPVTLRLTKEEKARLQVMASGMTVSAYIRQSLFGQRAAKRIVPETNRVILAQILAQLGQTRMANNLNQIAYHANCGSLYMDEATEEEIREACAHIAWMRVKLIEALGLKSRNKA